MTFAEWCTTIETNVLALGQDVEFQNNLPYVIAGAEKRPALPQMDCEPHSIEDVAAGFLKMRASFSLFEDRAYGYHLNRALRLLSKHGVLWDTSIFDPKRVEMEPEAQPKPRDATRYQPRPKPRRVQHFNSRTKPIIHVQDGKILGGEAAEDLLLQKSHEVLRPKKLMHMLNGVIEHEHGVCDLCDRVRRERASAYGTAGAGIGQTDS